jgi:hypothetical protein
MKKLSYLSVCLLALAITSCKKGSITQISDYAQGVQVKFIHVAPGTPALDGYINGTKVTPQQSVSVTDNLAATSIVTGYIYLGVFPGSNYAVVPSGSTAIKVLASTPVPALISAQTVSPGASLGSFTQTTNDGEAYSVFTMGLQGSATTPLTAKVVQDKFPAAVAGMAYIRFANFMPNGLPLDVTATYTPTGGVATTTTFTTNIAYPALTDFLPLPVNAASTTSYVLQAYNTGTTTKVGAALTLSLTPGRYYTVMARGLYADYPVPGTSITLKATARPTLPVTDNTTRFPEIYFNIPGLTYYTNK